MYVKERYNNDDNHPSSTAGRKGMLCRDKGKDTAEAMST